MAACGDPSPWSNYSSPRYKDLTAKHLQWLGQGSTEFTPFHFALIADPQVMIGHLREARSRVDRQDPAFTFILGDLTDRSLRKEFEWVAAEVEKFNRPVLTTPGNHDGLIYGKRLYRDMFGDPNYAFTYNGIRFVSFNNNAYEWGYPDFGFVEAEVEAHDNVVILAHQAPGRISAYPEANDRFRAFYESDHVLGSFHGHTHQFYYDEIAGKPVFITARVEHSRYSLVRFTEEMKLVIESCEKSACTTLP